jgi:PAS domain S-box-containing protein
MTAPPPPAVRRSLRRKLLLPLALLAVTAAIAIVAGIRLRSQRQFTRELEQRGELVAHFVNYAAEIVSRPGELQRIVTALGADTDILEIVVAGDDPARVLATTETNWLGRPLAELPAEEVADDLVKAINTSLASSHYNARRHLFDYTAPFHVNRPDGRETRGAIMVHVDTRAMELAVTRMTGLLSTAVIAVLSVLGALGYRLLNSRVLRPIAVLDRTAINHRTQSPEVWRDLDTDDEIGDLARRLRESFTQTDFALRELENQKFALDQHAVVAVIDPAGRFTHVNDKFCALSGYSRADLLGQPHRLLHSGIHPTEFYAEIQLSLAHDRVWRGELCNRAKDGSLYWTDATLVPLPAASGQSQHPYISIQTDITARRRAEEEIRDLNTNLERLISERTAGLVRSEAQLRLIWETSFDGLRLTDARGVVLSVNAAYCRLMNLPREALEGSSMTRGYAAVEHARMTEIHDRRFREGGSPGVINTRVKRHDDAVLEMELTNALVAPPGYAPVMFTAIRDVTERNAAEARLRQSDQRFRAVFEHSPIMLGLLTVPEGRLMEFNEACITAFGYSREEALGRTVAELGLWADPAQREHCLAELMDKGRIDGYETRLRRKNGELFTVLYSASLIDIAGQTYSLNSLLDITAQRASEQRLALALDATADGVWDWNITTGEVHFSPQWLRLLGLEPGEIPGRVESFFPLLHPDDAGHARAAIDEHLAGLTPFKQSEVRLRQKSGDYRWFLDRGKVVARDDSGHPLRMVGTLTDITERKQGERALMLTQFSIDRAVDAIFWIKADATILYVNDAATRVLGYSREEIVGRTVPDIDPNFPADAWPAHWAELKARKSLTFESDHATKSGGTLRTEVTANYIQFDGEEYNCAIMRDITERKRSERALEMMQFSVDHAADAVFWLGPDASIRYVNDAAVTRLGYPREELLRMSLLELDLDMPPPSWNEHWDQLKRAGSLIFERRHRTKDGRFITVEVNANYVSFGGHDFNFAFARDITERKRLADEQARLQERMYQNQKYEALGTLAGGVAHDFNNILTAVINYTALARDDCPSHLPHIRQFLDEALKGSERAKQLVRQILLFSRTQDAEREPQLLQPIVKDALSLLRSTLPTSVEIKTVLDPAAPPVLANATQLHQVVMNLAINAAHAMQSRGGLLTVQLGRRILETADTALLPELKPGPHVTLEITDTGAGMDTAVLARIFEPFFTTKPVGEGTGLGLAVVRSIVRGHDGAITVSSQPGQGSSFTLLLPVFMGTPAPSDAAPTSPPRGRGQHILAVDDEPMVVKSMHLMLERLGYRVTSCEHPLEALKRFQAAPDSFDAVITDYQMPAKNGIELTRDLLRIRPGLPVLVFSGYTGKITPEQMRAAGVAELVAKPINTEELARLLARHLG